MDFPRCLAAALPACLMLLCEPAVVGADDLAPIQGTAHLVIRRAASSTLSVDVVNPHAASLHIQWSVELADVDGRPITLPGGAANAFDAARGFSNRRISVDLPDAALPLHGVVILESGGMDKTSLSVVPLKIDTAGVETSGSWLVFSTLVLSMVLILGAWGVSRRESPPGPSLGSRMGQPAWDLDKSFASNVTFLGSIVGVVMATTVLPEQLALASRTAYIALNIVFSALIGLAPFVFSAIGHLQKPAAGSDVPLPGGYVATFLVSAALTGWGALGQITLLVALFFELAAGASIAVPIAVCFELVLGLVLIGLLLYVPATTFAILRGQRPAAGTADVRAMHGAIEANRASAGSAQADWLLL